MIEIICGCVCGIDEEPICRKSDLKTANNHSSSKQSVVNDTAADKCVFTFTYDDNDTTMQSKKCECTRCESLTFIFVYNTATVSAVNHLQFCAL